MSWSSLTPEQRGLLRWLAKYESEVNNKEYDVSWRPGNKSPVIANRTIRSRKAPGSLSKLNVQELQNQQLLTCSWSGDSVKFKLTAAAYTALASKADAVSPTLDPIPFATHNHAKVLQLREIITSAYNKEEFESLCFEINVNYDNLRGETLQAKVEALVSMYDRHRRLNELWVKVKQDRPNAFGSSD